MTGQAIVFELQSNQVLVLVKNKDRNRGSRGEAEANAQLCDSSTASRQPEIGLATT